MAEEQTVDDAAEKIKRFLMQHKNTLIIIGAVLVVVYVIIVLILNMISARSLEIEKQRNYYIDIEDQFVYDCDVEYDGKSSIYCESRTIGGNFSNYDTVEFTWPIDVTVDEDSFALQLSNYVESSVYKKESFDIDKLKDGMDEEYSFILENKILGKIVADRTVKVHYNFTQADLDLINQLHDKWVADEAERAAKAEQEAAQRRAEEEKREAEANAAKEEAERIEQQKKSGYVGQYTDGYYVWTFNADGTATFTANKNVNYKLNQDGSNYHKIRAESNYMDWNLIFSDDWSTLEAINGYNGEKTNYNKT